MAGQIIEKGALILRNAVGEATGEDGRSYEMSTTTAMAPLVKSLETGRTFSLSWSDLVNMAVDAGIDDEPAR